eukprot:TRINITY_DN8016_c0_g1_i2.p1 TRINITY_DN8016_c0_g1~~TRINITY_DN8016_c0_g1_i2.p1  ORF type:complete len:460 (+),score=56.09 TRINITY_DN8016_c0_g1_i2:183-1562(+)
MNTHCCLAVMLMLMTYLLASVLLHVTHESKPIVISSENKNGQPGPSSIKGKLLKSENCVQNATCEYFKDILVVIHLNPQRLDWLPQVMAYTKLFVPQMIFTSLPHPARTKNLTQEERRQYLDYLYLGPDKVPVHLIDNKYGLFGDHNDLVMAMKLFPGYKGYLYWAHEDTLVGFWNFLRLDKRSVWHQKIEVFFSFNHALQACKPKLRKPYRKAGSRVKIGSKTRCIVPMIAEEARDWLNLEAARQEIKNISEADYNRIQPGVTFGIPVYYAPGSIYEKLERYSKILYHADGVNEWSVHILLSAAGDRPANILNSQNIWPGQLPGRFHPVHEFNWGLDFSHPTRATGELFSRITDMASKVQITPDGPHVTNLTAFWSTPFTCDEYPDVQPFSHERKGRFHTCSPGCPHGAAPVPITSRNGAVCVRHNCTPPTEHPFEGFWSAASHDLIFGTYAKLNVSS